MFTAKNNIDCIADTDCTPAISKYKKHENT